MATGLAKGDADALDVMEQEETWVVVQESGACAE
jgi:hypothetical protein